MLMKHAMRTRVTFPVLPELSAIDFSSAAEVRTLVKERRYFMFGAEDDRYIDDFLDTIEGLFAGRYPEFQAMDTAYHDISHTMQATLCMVQLLSNRFTGDESPRISAEDFKRALVAILFHDIGYLKKTGDNEGSGAKYTHLHEKRSCDFVRPFLLKWGWQKDDFLFIENLISSTGPTADLTKIEFRSDIERLLGQAVCTADYVGQMSDPGYPDKLPVLFTEFRESYQYQQIPESDWPFSSYEVMLKGTPGFWSNFVQHKLQVECGGISRYLAYPFNGVDPYMESIERNLATIEQRISDLGI